MSFTQKKIPKSNLMKYLHTSLDEPKNKPHTLYCTFQAFNLLFINKT